MSTYFVFPSKAIVFDDLHLKTGWFVHNTVFIVLKSSTELARKKIVLKKILRTDGLPSEQVEKSLDRWHFDKFNTL